MGLVKLSFVLYGHHHPVLRGIPVIADRGAQIAFQCEISHFARFGRASFISNTSASLRFGPIDHLASLLPNYMLVFTVGGAIGMAYKAFSDRSGHVWWTFALGISVGFIYLLILSSHPNGAHYPGQLYVIFYNLYAVLIGISLIWIMQKFSVTGSKLFKLLSSLGASAFGIYLIHPAVLTVWTKFIHPVPYPELVTAAAKAAAAGEVEVIGIWSHFAYADAPGHPTIARQVAEFTDAVEVARRLGVDPPLRHLANSAATLTLPAAHFDLVRPGIAVYGLTPVPRRRWHGLHPGDDAALVGRAGQAGAGRQRRLVRARLHDRAGDRPGPGPARVRRRGAAQRDLGRPAVRSAAGAGRSPAGCAWTSSCVDVGDDAVAAGDEVVLFGPGRTASRPRRTGRTRPARSRTRSSTRVGARVPRAYRGQGAVRRRRASSASPPGSAGLVAAGAAVGLAAEKYAIGRVRSRPDPEADEPFGAAARRTGPRGAHRRRASRSRSRRSARPTRR